MKEMSHTTMISKCNWLESCLTRLAKQCYYVNFVNLLINCALYVCVFCWSHILVIGSHLYSPCVHVCLLLILFYAKSVILDENRYTNN
jgi:hypothetical protein